MRWKRPVAAVGAVAVLALGAAACGSDDKSDGGSSTGSKQASSGGSGGPTCDGGKIKIGAVSTLSGPVTFPDISGAAKATFDQINAKGGINGCKIDYIIGDDKGDPQVAAQAARDLVQRQGVVAMAGSGGLLDCEVNGNFYAQQKIGAVHGLGVDGKCWSTPNISPVNVGPFTLSTAVLYYATKDLKSEKPCVFDQIIAGTKSAYQKAVTDWEKLTGKKLALFDLTLPAQGDYTPYALRAKKAGCDTVLTNMVEPQILAWMKVIQQQKITGIKWLFLAPGYTDGVAKALANSKQPVYAGTEWEPFSEVDSPANKDWRAAMTAAGRPLTAFSQGGYESAIMMENVLKQINGKVTRESVYDALLNMKPIENPLVGTPYVFGKGDKHASNTATKIMKLENGKWTLVTPDWVVLPTS